jgi:hypothetical protein
MAIIEISVGPLTHDKLMRKTKDELATRLLAAERYIRKNQPDPRDAEAQQAWDDILFKIIFG